MKNFYQIMSEKTDGYNSSDEENHPLSKLMNYSYSYMTNEDKHDKEEQEIINNTRKTEYRSYNLSIQNEDEFFECLLNNSILMSDDKLQKIANFLYEIIIDNIHDNNLYVFWSKVNQHLCINELLLTKCIFQKIYEKKDIDILKDIKWILIDQSKKYNMRVRNDNEADWTNCMIYIIEYLHLNYIDFESELKNVYALIFDMCFIDHVKILETFVVDYRHFYENEMKSITDKSFEKNFNYFDAFKIFKFFHTRELELPRRIIYIAIKNMNLDILNYIQEHNIDISHIISNCVTINTNEITFVNTISKMNLSPINFYKMIVLIEGS